MCNPYFFSFVYAILIFSPLSLFAQPIEKVYQFEIMEEIAPPALRKVQKAILEAEKTGATHLLIRINTYGGMVDIADSIRTKLLNTPLVTVAFIDNNAASAGALISIACDSIYMRSSAAIGAATVVDGTGQVVPDKYQSYMRATMRATATQTGRNPQIAEAMVDPSIYIKGIIDSGKVLTFTTDEAILNGFCNSKAEDLSEVLKLLGLENATIVKQRVALLDAIIGFLLKPAISSVLILIILGGIYFELQSPGVGFPILAAILAAILYFAPLYLEGLANNWEIALFVIGVLLLAAEIFVIPGFGVAGILGLLCLIIGLFFALINQSPTDVFDDKPFDQNWVTALITVLLPITAALAAFIFLADKILQSPIFKRIVLTNSQNRHDGFVIAETENFVGKNGIVISTLRPSGKIEIDGKLFDARAVSGMLDPNDQVVVVAQERHELIVKKLNH